MSNRRGVLKGLFGLLLLPWTTGRAGPAAARPLPPGFRLVNGWVLTERDVAALAALGGPAGSRVE
jgi:hypothetical protein